MKTKMEAKPLFLAILLALLAGCSASSEYRHTRTSEVKTSDLIVEPKIGEVAVREIGEPLVKTGIRTLNLITVFKVTLNEPAEGSLGRMASGRKIQSPSGSSGELFEHGEDRSPMFCVNPRGSGETNVEAMSGCFVDTDKDGKFDSVAFPGHDVDGELEHPASYTVSKSEASKEIESPTSFWIEFLYQGISRGEAKISYREFKNGIARPAFTQDVTYELTPDGSGMIAFRGTRIKIIKATNDNITYMIQKIGAI